MLRMSLKNSRLSTALVIVALCAQISPDGHAMNPPAQAQQAETSTARQTLARAAFQAYATTSTSLKLDNVGLVIQSTSFPSSKFVSSEPGAAIQVASSTAWHPFQELSVTAIPFGRKPGNEALPAAAAGSAQKYEADLRTYRVRQGGKVQTAPVVRLFGQSVAGIQSVVDLFVDGPVQKPVLIDEWVVEAGHRLWIVRASQELLAENTRAQALDFTAGLTLDSTSLGNLPSTSSQTTAEGPQPLTPGLAASDLPTPAWWNGDCDYNTYLKQSGGIGSYRLGAVYLGLPACGPRPYADHAPDVLVRFFSGAWGEYEWECVELTMRFLYLMYGIIPYQANGSQVVWNYSGNRLVKIANGSLGQAPQPSDVLSYGSTSTFGHASVVTASNVDSNGNGTITIIEENNSSAGTSTLSVSNWVVAGNAGAVSGWLHDGSVATGYVDDKIAGTVMGSYYVPAAGRITPSYPGTFNGPVEVKSRDGANFFTSERAVYNLSFQDTLGFPANQLTTDYWFPWYDYTGMASWVIVGNTSSSQSANVQIYIAGALVGSQMIAPNGRWTPAYPGTFNGPVEVKSTNGVSIFSSQRMLYNNGLQETLGFPANQLTTDYWFSWYDFVNMSSWLVISNTSSSQSANVQIYMAGSLVDSQTIAPNGRWTPSYPGTFNGPVEVKSTNGVNILTSQRILYNGGVAETLGFPAGQLSTDYLYTWYDYGGMSTWIAIGNTSGSQSANVQVYIAGTLVDSQTIAPNGHWAPGYPGVVNGPVEVKSTNGVNVFTSQRILYNNLYKEMPGFPVGRLTNDYWFPWYDFTGMSTWIVIAKP